MSHKINKESKYNRKYAQNITTNYIKSKNKQTFFKAFTWYPKYNINHK